MTIYDELKEYQANLIELQSQNKRNEARDLFKEFIEKVCSLGPYSSETWPITWTRTFWEFSGEVSEDFSNLYINCIDSELDHRKDCSEQLEFLKVELMWAKKSAHTYAQAYVKNLVEKYPFNIEFKHSYGHILIANMDDVSSVSEGLDQYLYCLDVWGSAHKRLRSHIVNVVLPLAHKISQKGQFTEAINLINKVYDNKHVKKSPDFNNILLINKDLIRERENIHQYIEGIEKKLSIDFEHKLRDERKKSFELLGLFTAAISFILSTVSLTGVISFELLIPVIFTLGLILIMFVLTISLSLSTSDALYKDFRIYILLAYLIIGFIVSIMSIYGGDFVNLLWSSD